MIRRAARPAAAAAALLLALSPAGAARAAGEEPLRATILFTGDVLGYTEPCG